MTTLSASSPEGTLPPFVRRTLGLRSPRQFRYDSVVRARKGAPVLLLTHPDDVRHVLVTGAPAYTKTRRLVSEQGRRRAGSGILTSTGAEHLHRRRLLQPIFRREAVAALDATIVRCVGSTTARWHRAGPIDVGAEMTDLARSVMLDALFGAALPDDVRRDAADAITARRRYTELVYHGRLPFRERLPTPTVREHRAALETLDRIIGAATTACRAGAAPNSLVARLLAARADDGSKLSDREVRDDVLTFTSTGYETLADALTWAAYLLSRNPATAAAVAAEAELAIGRRAPEAAVIGGLPLTAAVLAETLRLYPPTWLYARVPQLRDVLPVAGPVSPRWTLYVCPYVMHRHPRFFPDPERFDPARFCGAPPPRYVYMPFGDGLHRCLGEHLARLEGTLVIALVTRKFRLQLLTDADVEPRAGLTLTPAQKLWAHATPRAGLTAR